MKIVKAELEDEVHRGFKMWAAGRGVSMSEAIQSWVRDAVFPPVDLKIGKVSLSAHPPAPLAKPKRIPDTVLKEGFGWCKGCGVGQVKLPGMLCDKCRKEAGEDL